MPDRRRDVEIIDVIYLHEACTSLIECNADSASWANNLMKHWIATNAGCLKDGQAGRFK